MLEELISKVFPTATQTIRNAIPEKVQRKDLKKISVYKLINYKAVAILQS
jgi:hypothetical protein